MGKRKIVITLKEKTPFIEALERLNKRLYENIANAKPLDSNKNIACTKQYDLELKKQNEPIKTKQP